LIAKSIENFSEAAAVFGEKGGAGGYACWVLCLLEEACE